MENFWTDTPFGITLLASLTITVIAGIVLVVSNVVRPQNTTQSSNAATWPKLVAHVCGYELVMIIVTYAAILVYYISGGVLDLFENRYSLSFNHFVWMAVQIWSVGIWLGTAILIFRRMFRRWL